MPRRRNVVPDGATSYTRNSSWPWRISRGGSAAVGRTCRALNSALEQDVAPWASMLRAPLVMPGRAARWPHRFKDPCTSPQRGRPGAARGNIPGGSLERVLVIGAARRNHDMSEDVEVTSRSTRSDARRGESGSVGAGAAGERVGVVRRARRAGNPPCAWRRVQQDQRAEGERRT